MRLFMKIRGIALSIELLIFTQTFPNFFFTDSFVVVFIVLFMNPFSSVYFLLSHFSSSFDVGCLYARFIKFMCDDDDGEKWELFQSFVTFYFQISDHILVVVFFLT